MTSAVSERSWLRAFPLTGKEVTKRITHKLCLLTGAEVFPTSTLRQSSGRPPARVPEGRGAVSESRRLGKVQGPKRWRCFCACRPRSPGHVSFDSVFVRAPVVSLPSLHRSDSSASSKAGGRAGSRGGRGFRKRDPEDCLSTAETPG